MCMVGEVMVMSKVCDICHANMIAGYVIDDGIEYYCSDDCLHGAYSEEEYDELCQEGRGYWTEWDDAEELRGENI